VLDADEDYGLANVFDAADRDCCPALKMPMSEAL
jgi:hypothetical protein